MLDKMVEMRHHWYSRFLIKHSVTKQQFEFLDEFFLPLLEEGLEFGPLLEEGRGEAHEARGGVLLELQAQIEEKRQAIRRSRFLEFWDVSTAMGSVGGMDALKRWLEQRALAFSEDARQFGLPEPRGIFLLGVQGRGKSLMAKAVAGMWQMPLLRLDVAAVFSSAGREEESLRETVRIAESLAPVGSELAPL